MILYHKADNVVFLLEAVGKQLTFLHGDGESGDVCYILH